MLSLPWLSVWPYTPSFKPSATTADSNISSNSLYEPGLILAEPVSNSILYDLDDTASVIWSAYFASIALPCNNSGWFEITLNRNDLSTAFSYGKKLGNMP